MIKGFLIDVEGTIIESDLAIDGAIDVINRIKSKYRLLLLSNTTNNTGLDIANKLNKLGFDINEEEVFTALDAIKRYLIVNKLKPFLLSSEKTRRVLNEFSSEPYDSVVVTHARENFTYENINKAFRLILNGCKFISSGLTKYFKDKDGYFSLDAGAFTYALKYSTGVEPIILGKPSKDFFILGINSISLKPNEVVVVGDDVENDIKPASEIGMKTVLVKSGKFRDSDLLKGITPDFVIDTIKELDKVVEI